MHHPILVLGSTCVDVIIRLQHLPKTEEDMHPESQRVSVGGCAWNVANLLGRAGADVRLVTPVGLQGLYGPWLLSRMQKAPWATPVKLEDKENGCCYCLVEASGERTFLSLHGVEYTFDEAWVQDVTAGMTYVCGLEVEERCGQRLVAWLETGKAGQIFYAPGPRGNKIDPTLTERLLALHPILHMNRDEAAGLTGEPDLMRAMQALFRKTQRPVIVTLGAQGAAALDGDGLHEAKAVSVEAVADTIGAGDAHAGAMLLGLSRGYTIQASLEMANRAAAMAVRVHGAEIPDAALREIL